MVEVICRDCHGTVWLWWNVGLLAVLLCLPLWLFVGPIGKPKECRCGHHRSIHRGPGTQCLGYRRAGRNSLGHLQFSGCPCQQYRRTSRTWWQMRITGPGAEDLTEPEDRE